MPQKTAYYVDTLPRTRIVHAQPDERQHPLGPALGGKVPLSAADHGLELVPQGFFDGLGVGGGGGGELVGQANLSCSAVIRDFVSTHIFTHFF